MDGKFLESELALLASMANFFKKIEKSTPSPNAPAAPTAIGGAVHAARRDATLQSFELRTKLCTN